MKFIKKGFWRTREQVLVLISDMTDEHLTNTIRMMKRYGEARLWRTQQIYMHCPAPTADIAEMLFDQEAEYWTCEADWYAALAEHQGKFDELVDEAEKRNLAVVKEVR